MIDFNTIMTPYSSLIADEEDIAIGVSGGGDSIALAHILSLWCKKNKKTLHIVTIDHNLRTESAKEAEKVQKWVEKWPNTHHKTVKWTYKEKPESRIQEAARHARHQLLENYCNDNNIKSLFIAHHGDDQYETFMMRLSSGSGLKGLRSMTDVTTTQSGLKKIRPLLNITHEQLIEYCRTNKLEWIEDPSNEDEKYRRVRYRKSRPFFEDDGLSLKRVSTLIKRISRAREALEFYAEQALNNIRLDESTDKLYSLDFKAFKSLPEETALIVLEKVMVNLAGNENAYPPNTEKCEDLYKRMTGTDTEFKGSTLYKCRFSPRNKGQTLHIFRE